MFFVKLCDKLSIDIWKEIADIVQLMDIYTFDNEEFVRNLIFLREKLMESGKIVNFGRTNPRYCLEVGLLNLLRAIYSADVYDDYKKANFYEKIYQLDELGIPNVVFDPIGFPDSVANISFIRNMDDDIVGIYKCYTDGEFRINYTDSPRNRWFDLVDIREDNYMINILIEKENDKLVIDKKESCAILKNFNGFYPSKETLYELDFPSVDVYFKDLDDGRRQEWLRQRFYQMSRDEVNYPKKLVRMKDNYHYE